MTILISIGGFIFRFAEGFLTTSLGWASNLMFGRVPRSHQVFVNLMFAGSLLWLFLLIGFLAPGVPSFFLQTTPHPNQIDRPLLGIAILIGLIVLPLIVGAASYLVPSDGERASGLGIVRELLRGYVLVPVLCFLLLFLTVVGIARKVRSVTHRWSDVHVPIVVKPKGYDQLVTDLGLTLTAVDLPVVAEDAPRVLSFPAWLLSRVAGDNVRKMRPDRLIELEGEDLRIGVYPSDIAISGPEPVRIRARAAIVSRLATTAAYLTTSAESQAIEDRLHKVAERFESPAGAPAGEVAAALAAIDETLLEIKLPTDEWDILYRSRLQVERDALAGTRSRGLPLPAMAEREGSDTAKLSATAVAASHEAAG
jgi:hypothetical protein